MSNLGKCSKSLVGALVAGLGAIQVALVDDVVTTQEWITVAVATLAALGLVWGIPNDDPTPASGDAIATEDLGDAPVPAHYDPPANDLP